MGDWARGWGGAPQGLPVMLRVLSSGVPCTENDYKLWSPSDERGSECLLGHKTVFKRRIPHATCFNGEDFDRPVVTSNCSCTRQDYEWCALPRCLGLCGASLLAAWRQARVWCWPLRKGGNPRKQIFIKHLAGARTCAGPFSIGYSM